MLYKTFHPASSSEELTTTGTTLVDTSSTGTCSLRFFFQLVRLVLLSLPLYGTLLATIVVHGVVHMYQGPISQLFQSLALSNTKQDENGLYVVRYPEITYYHRQCHMDDISTNDSKDLLIHDHYNKQQRKDVMMKHGAVVMKNLLSHNTSTKLREYLETRHDTFVTEGGLPYDELFWDGGSGNRLSLGIGPEDDPIIAQALYEVSHNQNLEQTLEAIVGKNPSIVEVSTLTTMHKAKPQGIHTDSDFFGSSVMYARTFFHSYTMFIALQDTTALMGATTLCPGSHFCANEDLEEVCMSRNTLRRGSRPNSFEASSNGLTGIEKGELLQGDAMMFNQNVWHRGPSNNDPKRPYNRVMFILTFVSQREFEKGDVRQQGWGTYYYMRHSMWGQAFQDLKRVLQGGMNVPLRLLKAYGLYSTPTSGNGRGVPWLEHFARQLSNEMDFFAPSELSAFRQMLTQSSMIPKFLLVGDDDDEETDDWNTYLLRIMNATMVWMDSIYLRVLLTYLVIHAIGYYFYIVHFRVQGDGGGGASSQEVSQGPSGSTTTATRISRDVFRFVTRLVLGHILIIGIFWMMYWYILNYSPLFQRIHSGYIFRKPFPELPNMLSVKEILQGRITSDVDRMDILIGSRFDAPYLASMNEMLDYHPGNKAWKEMVHNAAGFPDTTIASQVLVHQIVTTTSQTNPSLYGVVPQRRPQPQRRFLLQDYQTGYWTIMNLQEVHEKVKQDLILAHSPLLTMIVSYWKEVLADARFGMFRDTSLAKTLIPKRVQFWFDEVLFSGNKDEENNAAIASRNAILHSKKGVIQRSSVLLLLPTSWTQRIKVPSRPVPFRKHLVDMTRDMIVLKEGDYVTVLGTIDEMEEEEEEETETVYYPPYMAKIVSVESPWKLKVRPVDSYRTKRLSIHDIQPYDRPIQQGDFVFLPTRDYWNEDDEEEDDDDLEDWMSCLVLLVHPFGTADVLVKDDVVVTVNLAEVWLDRSKSQQPNFRLHWIE